MKTLEKCKDLADERKLVIDYTSGPDATSTWPGVLNYLRFETECTFNLAEQSSLSLEI